MSTLVDFLLARIADEERLAERASGRSPGFAWHGDWATPDVRVRQLINTFEPARVLAECEAKRRIIDLAFVHMQFVDGELGCSHSADQIRNGRCDDIDPAEDSLLRVLALPYADHSDYRDEWRP